MSTDERREQLLSVGVELVTQRGYDDISIEEIAEAADVSKGLLYHYFPTKKDFLLAAIARGEAALEARLRPDPGISPEAQLNAGLDVFLDDVEEHTSAYSAIFRHRGGGDPEIVAALDAGRVRRMESLLEGLAGWEGPVDTARSPTLEAAVQGWVFFAEGVVLRWLEHSGLERDQVRVMLQVALGGALMAAKAAAELPGDSN